MTGTGTGTKTTGTPGPGPGPAHPCSTYLSVVSSVFRDTFALLGTNVDKDQDGLEQFKLNDLDASEFKEFLGVIYPTRYLITDKNVISLFRIADRFGVQSVVADCEAHLMGANKVPWFDKLKVTVDRRRVDLRNHLIATMTCDDVNAIKRANNRQQLGEDVLQAVSGRHFGIRHHQSHIRVSSAEKTRRISK
ncbi:Protein BATH-36 [Aphelenchoides avenae]|nr:Protein BATH-36 [Aphelenchus avenae]